MLIDGRGLSATEPLTTDVCIVGGGPAGIVLALELERAGREVLLLESGGVERDPAVDALSEGETVSHPYPMRGCRVRALGGSSEHWNGFCRPLDAVDLTAREWIPMSGWPLERSVLDPCYARAQELCGLGPPRYDAEHWRARDGVAPFPMEGTDVSSEVFQIGPPVRFGAAHRAALERSERVRVVLHASALGVDTDPEGGRTTGVRAGTLEGTRFAVRARHVVLAAGGIENARLLLLSATPERGAPGNAGDMVGRCFMEHLHAGAGVIFLPSSPELDGSFYLPRLSGPCRVQGVFVIDPERRARERMPAFSATVYPVWPESASGEATVRDVALPDEGHRLLVGADAATFERHIARVLGEVDPVPPRALARAATGGGFEYHFLCRTEQVPNPDSRITLGEERDALGLPRARLDWKLTERDGWGLVRGLEILAMAFGEAGLGRMQAPSRDPAFWAPRIVGGCHHMGTTRMSADPRHGVVDADGRVHGYGNLWVAGSSVFPTSGAANPTLTLVALALRLAERLAAPEQP